MIQELYINNVLMDLDDKFSIALLYDSMLFTDINYIMSNRSTGFNLPKTASNLRAVEHAELSDIQDDPGVKMLYPRRNHKVDYYQNGVPIVTNALGVMMDIGDRINFVFIFGNMENTRHLEKKMSELSEYFLGTYVAWNSDSQVSSYGWDQPGFAYMDYGRGAGLNANNREFNHPVAPVPWIIDLIASSNGLTIDRGEHFKDMFIPLVTKKTTEEVSKRSGLAGTVGIKLYATQGQSIYALAFNQISHANERILPASSSTNSIFYGGRTGGYSGLVRIQLNGGNPFDITEQTNNMNFNLSLEVWPGDITYYEFPYEIIKNDSTGLTKRYVVDMVFDASEFESWQLRVGTSSNTFKSISLPDSMIWIQDTETYFGNRGGIFPVIPNLPDMKQVEFLKHMLQLRGLFAYPKGLNHIGLISADELIAKKPDALNWTDKLVTDSPIPNAPEGIDFKMNNFAQKNWFRWDNDDEVNALNTDASMTVYNETLEREREALKLPFSGSKNTAIGGETDARLIASIPLYDQDGKMAKLKPRILMGHAGAGGRLEVAFESLGFNHILNTYYDGYRRIVEHPRVITIRVKLTDLDLTEMDLTRPVYFEQFGRHYAILSVQAQADGLCKCKLLEI